MSSHGAAETAPKGYDGDSGFGDSGRFGAVAARQQEIHWPTVLVAGAVAAVISSLILTLGVIGFHRGADGSQPVVVAVDPQGAVSVDGTQVAAGGTSSSSDPLPGSPDPTPDDDATGPAPSDSPGPGSTAPAASDGGGLSPSTGVTPAPAEPPPAAASSGEARAEEAPAPGRGATTTPTDEGPDRVTGWTPPGPLPADFQVTAAEPTLDDLNAIVHLLVATPASDEAKSRNLEAGPGGVVVPKTVYNLGVFRAPQGWKRITGPVERNGDSLTAILHSESAGRPSITTRVVFVLRDGNWKLSTRSVCEGVRTVGLPVPCGG